MATNALYRNAANNQLLMRDTKLIYDGATSLLFDFLLVGGGGSGGNSGGGTNSAGGGGGAGGFIYNTGKTISTGTYLIIIGGSDQNTTFSGLTANAGGGGGTTMGIGGNGGCGGGAGGWLSGGALTGGIASQGFNGGSSAYSLDDAAGGGGLGAVGENCTSTGTGTGGAGTKFTIFNNNFYGGGGGGGHRGGVGSAGGSSIGGGGSDGNSNGGNGVVNTGSGGGGGAGPNTVGKFGGSGGSGIVLLRFLTSDLNNFTITGGSSAINGSYTIITFTSSDNLKIDLKSFLPSDISGMISWFREYVNGGINRMFLSNGANINQWDDKSGNGNHADGKQGQPIWLTGIQSIYFNTTSALGNLTKKLTPANNICTVFLVGYADYTGGNDAFYLWLSGSVNATSMNFLLQSAADQANLFINATQTVIACTGQSITSLYTIISTDGKSANATVKRNTITLSKTGGSTSTMTADNGFNIGGVVNTGVLQPYHLHSAYIKEIITFNSALSSGDISSVEQYLNTKYSLY